MTIAILPFIRRYHKYSIFPSISRSQSVSSTLNDHISHIPHISHISSIMKDISKLSRIYYQDTIELNKEMTLKDDMYHYLMNVMRIKQGQYFRIFNEVSGEYIGQIITRNKHHEVIISICHQIRLPIYNNMIYNDSSLRSMTLQENQDFSHQYYSNNEYLPIILFFSPIKKQNLRFLLMKATEMGVNVFVPVICQHTDRSVTELENIETLYKYLIESCEQCERLSLPRIYETLTFDKFLKLISENKSINETFTNSDVNDQTKFRTLKTKSNIFNSNARNRKKALERDETSSIDAKALSTCKYPIFPSTELPRVKSILIGRERPSSESLDTRLPIYIAVDKLFNSYVHDEYIGILCGPEGGFTKEEFTQMESLLSRKQFISLGNNILRSETAVIAAVSCVANAWEKKLYLERVDDNSDNINNATESE